MAMLEEVHEGKEYVITKRGKPVAKLVPVAEGAPAVKGEKVQYAGRMKGTIEILGDIYSTGAKWYAESDDHPVIT